MRFITVTLLSALFGLLATAAQAASVSFTFNDVFQGDSSTLDNTPLEVTLVVDDELAIGETGTLDSTVSFSFAEYSGSYTPMYISRVVGWGGGVQPNFTLSDTVNPDGATIELWFSHSSNSVLDSVEDLVSAAMASQLTVSYDLNFEIMGDEQALEGIFDRTSVSEVPLPAAVWLFASGLAGFVAISRRRQARA